MRMNNRLTQQLAGQWEVTVEVSGHDGCHQIHVYCQSSPLWKFVDFACQRLGFKLHVGNVVEAVASVGLVDLAHRCLQVKLKSEQVRVSPPVRSHVRF